MPEKQMGKHDEKRGSGELRMDAIRHVGKTLEAEGTYLPTEDLPENRIEMEDLTDTADMDAVTADQHDREANAMGAERLRTRLSEDTSSEPHTDLGADNATNIDRDRDMERPRRRGKKAA